MEYEQEYLEDLCSKVNLLEYAEQTLKFHKCGDEYFCSCPNHLDRTPSLAINPKKNVFVCHSCHAGGNIFNWLMTYEHMTFDSAVKKVAEMTGSDLKKMSSPCDSIKYYKMLKRLQDSHSPKEVNRELLSPDYYDQFVDEAPQEWIDEGMSPDMLKKYSIRIDNRTNRIVYPIYDNNDNLIGVKGRTRFNNFKDLEISKYQYYKKIQTNDFFVGMHENRQDILDANEVVIFEGIKSGIKLSTFGQNNWLAAETSMLNAEQIKILLKLNIKNVIIAFDSDVALDKIKDNVKQLKKFTNVYVVYDRWKLLGEKMSPVDMGKDTWEKLLANKIRI